MGSLSGRAAHWPAVFDWLEGGAFLIEHSVAESPEFPGEITIISGDDSLETYCMLQTDSRGISRIYQVSLSDDGRTISGRREKSNDGLQWELGFDLTYIKKASKLPLDFGF